MADKPDMEEIASFHKAELKKTGRQEKNTLPTLPTKETTEQEKRVRFPKSLGDFSPHRT
nr:LOW QUALITY PROTEIN: thymosin beta-10-like [Cavia porcellus]